MGIARPRQSLSCLACRRRKVRCGREQPACSNCVRFHEACEYESEAPDSVNRQAKRKLTTGPLRPESAPAGLSPLETAEPLSDWSAQQPQSPSSQTFHNETDIEADESSRYRTASRNNPLSASSSLDRRTGVTISSGNRSFAQTHRDKSNHFFPQSRPQDSSLDSTNIPSWDTYPQEDLRHPLELPTPSLTTSTAGESASSPPQKRQRTTQNYASLQDPAEDQEVRLEISSQRRGRTGASADFGTSNVDEDRIRSVGYLSIQKGGRIRHVDDMFWGLIKGHVSHHLKHNLLFFWSTANFITGIAL